MLCHSHLVYFCVHHPPPPPLPRQRENRVQRFRLFWRDRRVWYRRVCGLYSRGESRNNKIKETPGAQLLPPYPVTFSPYFRKPLRITPKKINLTNGRTRDFLSALHLQKGRLWNEKPLPSLTCTTNLPW
jgi:hypothetical protein